VQPIPAAVLNGEEVSLVRLNSTLLLVGDSLEFPPGAEILLLRAGENVSLEQPAYLDSVGVLRVHLEAGGRNFTILAPVVSLRVRLNPMPEGALLSAAGPAKWGVNLSGRAGARPPSRVTLRFAASPPGADLISRALGAAPGAGGEAASLTLSARLSPAGGARGVRASVGGDPLLPGRWSEVELDPGGGTALVVESLPRGDLELRIDLRVALSFGGRRWTREASLMIRRAAAHPWEGVLESAPEWDCRALSGLPSECEVRLSPLPGVDLSGLGVVGEGCGVSVLEVSADGVRFDVEGRAPGSECRLMLMLGDRSIDSRVVRAEPPVELSLDLPGEVPVGGTANATLTVVNRAGVDVAGLVVSASASGAGGCSVSPDSAPVNVSAGGSVEVPFSVRVSREGPCGLRFSAALGGVEVEEERGSIAGVGWISLSLSAPSESVGDFNVTILLMNTHSSPVNLTVELSSSGSCEVSYRTLAVPVPPGGRSEVEVPVRVTGSGECSVSARISGGPPGLERAGTHEVVLPVRRRFGPLSLAFIVMGAAAVSAVILLGVKRMGAAAEVAPPVSEGGPAPPTPRASARGRSKKPLATLGFAAVTDLGRVRGNNEDAALVLRPDAAVAFVEGARQDLRPPRIPFEVYGVFDGVGGQAKGAVASRMALEAILARADRLPRSRNPGAELAKALEEAHSSILGYVGSHPEAEGMATTATACALSQEGTLWYAHVGDSRLYVVRRDGTIERVTRDHSVVADLLERGLITEEEARRHPQRHVITRAVGVYASANPDVGAVRLEPGDYVLLCSDGLTDFVSDAEIAEVVLGSGSPEEAAESLVDLALERGGRDNVTVVLAGPLVGG
ncbi:MAG: protein phosphatase 2C domain-containing protein, partial [Candidatus Korarchaeota archaeon]|nr:protein phosphatase 2C domain-containing protein [Candidatus Korarchaeota archaeon]